MDELIGVAALGAIPFSPLAQARVAGGDQGFPFCNTNDNLDASHYYCGA
jgi:hypothetical protein